MANLSSGGANKMENLKQRWRFGDYTPVGYLIEILETMAAIGEPIAIPNVKEFCQTWEISERQFYRAKAKLVARGDLEEECGGLAINLLD
jgi:hypothetical protein